MSEKRTLVSFDWAIKNILRDKSNYDVLEGFLSTLLDRDIRILSLLESESNQDDASDKFNRVDLSVEDEAGDIYVIEVQALSKPCWEAREQHTVLSAQQEMQPASSIFIRLLTIKTTCWIILNLNQGWTSG